MVHKLCCNNAVLKIVFTSFIRFPFSSEKCLTWLAVLAREDFCFSFQRQQLQERAAPGCAPHCGSSRVRAARPLRRWTCREHPRGPDRTRGGWGPSGEAAGAGARRRGRLAGRVWLRGRGGDGGIQPGLAGGHVEEGLASAPGLWVGARTAGTHLNAGLVGRRAEGLRGEVRGAGARVPVLAKAAGRTPARCGGCGPARAGGQAGNPAGREGPRP